MNLVFFATAQVTAKYPDLCNSFILVPRMFYGTQFSICNYLNVNSDKDNDFIESRIRDLLEIYKTSQKTESTPTLKSIQLILISYIFNHVVFIFLKSFSRLELFMIICCKKNQSISIQSLTKGLIQGSSGDFKRYEDFMNKGDFMIMIKMKFEKV